MRALIADPDPERARRIGLACAARGLAVDRATHGAQALERALKQPPDVVICSLELGVIDGGRLSEILRANPRTKGVRFLYLLEDELDAPVGFQLEDRLVLAPWGEKEVLEGLDHTVEPGPAPQEPRGGNEVAGNLAQITLLDLLQLFHLTRKTGTVCVAPESGPAGTVLVRGGEIVEATVDAADGQPIHGAKALFRLMGLREGRFEFMPEDPGGPRRIEVPTRTLLLEGVRQIDEAARFRQLLPSPEVRVRLGKPLEQLPPAAHPLTQDVLRAAKDSSTVQVIVDRVPFPDYQVLRTLHALLLRGIVETDSSQSPSGSAPVVPRGEGLFSPVQARSIADWASLQRPSITGAIRVPVIASNGRGLRDLLAAISEFPEVSFPDPQPAGEEPGLRLQPLAEIALDEPLSLSLVSLPADERFRPIWSVVGDGILGALLVLERPLPESLARAEAVLTRLEATGRPVVGLVTGAALDDTPTEGEGTLLRYRGRLIPLPDQAGEERRAAVRTLFSRLEP